MPPLWIIPVQRMKMRGKNPQPHYVPLWKQAFSILLELKELTGSSTYVFESLRAGRPISENAMNYALRALGYSGDRHVANGFRSSASSQLHELGWPSMDIELQLAHVDQNAVRSTYNHTKPWSRGLFSEAYRF